MLSLRIWTLGVAYLLINLLPFSALAETGVQECGATYNGTAREVRISSRAIHEYRTGLIEADRQSKKGPSIFRVGEVVYTKLGYLGESSSKVYLATDPKGGKVVIKEQTFLPEQSRALNLAYYEVAVSEFYEAQGYPVPKIRAVELKGRKITIVKEYREGLLFDDIHRFPGLTENQRIKLEAAGYLEMKRAEAIFDPSMDGSRFLSWLGEYQPYLESKWPTLLELHAATKDPGEFNELALTGDVAKKNMLFDSQLQRWILFDP